MIMMWCAGFVAGLGFCAIVSSHQDFKRRERIIIAQTWGKYAHIRFKELDEE